MEEEHEFEKPLTKSDLTNLIFLEFGIDLRYTEAFTIEYDYKKYETGVYIKSKGLAMQYPINESDEEFLSDEDDESDYEDEEFE